MAQRAERIAREKRKTRVGFFTALAILVLLVLVGYQVTNLQGRLELARAEETALAEQIAQQKQENAALEAALERADDPEYLRELAREQLDMVSPGQKDFYDVSN